jgi:hypothetical protein
VDNNSECGNGQILNFVSRTVWTWSPMKTAITFVNVCDMSNPRCPLSTHSTCADTFPQIDGQKNHSILSFEGETRVSANWPLAELRSGKTCSEN